MKSKLIPAVTALVWSSVTLSQGATLTWDPGASGTGATFGSGTWDNTSSIWSNGATDTTYVSASDAVFGGTSTGSATVNLASAQNANTVTLNSTGYTFTGSALTISGTFATAPGIALANGVSATFNNAVNFTNGTGTFSSVGLGTTSSLTLGGGGTSGGTFKVSNLANTGATTGTLTLSGGTYTLGALWTQATVNQGAATVNTGTALIGYAGNSIYTLNNAASVFNVTNGQSMYLGRGGTSGTMMVQSGALNLTGTGGLISVGFRDGGSSGTLNVSGGMLSAATNTIYLVDAFNGGTGSGYSGTMTVSAGTATVAGITFFGASNSTTPGTAFSGTNTATLNVSGGALYLGAGGLTLSTTTSGTRTTAINLSGGTVGATAAWTSSLPMTLTNTATFQTANASGTAYNIGLGGVLSGTGSLTETGGGTLTLSGANTYTGTTTISSGSTLGLTGSIGANGGGTGTAITNSGTFTESSAGVIAGTSSFTNNAGTATLSGANTYSGLTTINGGTVTLGNAQALGFGNVAKVVFGANSNGILQLNGNSTTLRSLNTNATVGTPIIENANATAVILTESVRSTDPVDTYAGLLRDGTGGGTLALTKGDTGTLILSGSNTYTGGTNVNSGIVVAGNNTAFGTGTLGIGNAAVIASDSDTRTVSNALSINGDATFGSTSLSAAQNRNLTFTGTVNTGGGTKTFTVNNASTELTNVISGGGGATNIIKAGTGTLIFSGANTYNKPTLVNAGTLLANGVGSGAGSSATGTNTVTVTNTGSTLGGTGRVAGAVTVNSGAYVLGGTGSTATGALTLAGGLTLNSGSLIELALGAGGAHSSLARTGGTFTFDPTQTFTFIDVGAMPGIYDNIITGLAADPGTEGSWTITNPGYVGTFSYDGANIDLTVTAVPEASTWLGGAFAVLALAFHQRRRLIGLIG